MTEQKPKTLEEAVRDYPELMLELKRLRKAEAKLQETHEKIKQMNQMLSENNKKIRIHMEEK